MEKNEQLESPKFLDDFRIYENIFALSLDTKVTKDVGVECDMILMGDIQKLEIALVEKMKIHPILADLIYNAAFEFMQFQQKRTVQN